MPQAGMRISSPVQAGAQVTAQCGVAVTSPSTLHRPPCGGRWRAIILCYLSPHIATLWLVRGYYISSLIAPRPVFHTVFQPLPTARTSPISFHSQGQKRLPSSTPHARWYIFAPLPEGTVANKREQSYACIDSAECEQLGR